MYVLSLRHVFLLRIFFIFLSCAAPLGVTQNLGVLPVSPRMKFADQSTISPREIFDSKSPSNWVGEKQRRILRGRKKYFLRGEFRTSAPPSCLSRQTPSAC